MQKGFTIGEVRGVKITADVSWFVFLLLSLYFLAAVLFPSLSVAREWGGGLQFAAALVVTLLFFLSVLAHELGHALVIRAAGLPVRGIMLYSFGGATLTDAEPKHPGEEFRIAAVGPFVSLLLSALFFGLALLLGLDHPDPAPVCAWLLAILNFSMGAFNLLPGAPLDGGKVLHAAAWQLTGDPARADRIAAQGGQALGLLVIALGIAVLVLTGDFFIGLFTIYIGWSMSRQSWRAYREAVSRRLLHSTAAADAMMPAAQQIPPSHTLTEALDQFVVGRLSVESQVPLPVGEGGNPVGLIAPAAMSKLPAEERSHKTVRELMEPIGRLVSVPPDLKLFEVLLRMEAASASHAVVTNDGLNLGLISRESIAYYLVGMIRSPSAK